MPYFKGKMINCTTGNEEEICIEAFEESPECKLKLDDEGGRSLIGLNHQDADEYPAMDFYVGEGEFSDGTWFELTSHDLPKTVKFVENEDDPIDEDDEDSDEVF